MLFFEPVSSFKPGDLADIIRRCYAGLIKKDREFWAAVPAKWDEFDRQAFDHPNTFGKCIFVGLAERREDRGRPESRSRGETRGPGLDLAPVGLASYDPRHGPRFGIVGQNCVVPEYRGRGFGKMQILEVLRRFRAMNIGEARVTTSEHPFFIPALRMYVSLGFKESRRYAGGPDPRYRLIDLELVLVA